jgi:hypothetical protein
LGHVQRDTWKIPTTDILALEQVAGIAKGDFPESETNLVSDIMERI